jgi:CheY-like chemotaxis protein
LPIVEEMLTLLELRNIPATAASCLDEAVLTLQECHNISVIVCDVRLGKDSGLDLYERVKASNALSGRRFEYVFVTGDPMGVEHIPYGLNPAILTKPIRPGELIGLIGGLLGKGS